MRQIQMEQLASFWGNGTPQALPRLSADFGESSRKIVWNVAEEDISHVPEHWFGFPSPHPLNNYLLGFLYVLFFIMALFGNGLVIWIFSTAKTLRTPSNMFVVTLAIFDFAMMAKAPIMIYNSMNLGFVSGQFWCQVFAFVGSVTGIGAAATNACIAYDRYSTISNPMGGGLSRTKAFIMVILIWAYTLPWAILPLLEIWGRFVPEGYLTTCSFDYLSDSFSNKSFVATLFVVSYILPMSFIIFFYSQIVSHVVNHEKSLREQAAITICSLFVASWTPYAVIALIGSFGNKALITPGLSMIPACTCKAVACLDPYVYAISHPRYRAELEKRLPWLGGCVREPPETASTTTEHTSAPAAAT